MIDLMSYHLFETEGKTAEEIMYIIKRLKRSISQRKEKMESSLKGDRPPLGTLMSPAPDIYISIERSYLENAIHAYNDAGGTYKYSKAETAAKEFEMNLNHIYAVRFKIGSSRKGYTTRTMALVGDQLLKSVSHSSGLNENCKSEFLHWEGCSFGLYDLHIGEWKRCYHNPCVLDGTQWSLEIFYNNGRAKFECRGSNAYPYNFNRLYEVFGAYEYIYAYHDIVEDEEET